MCIECAEEFLEQRLQHERARSRREFVPFSEELFFVHASGYVCCMVDFNQCTAEQAKLLLADYEPGGAGYALTRSQFQK